jgi:putative transposase
MPRSSPYHIVLSKDEHKQLESISREYTSPYFYVVRAKIALYAAQGMRNEEIAHRLDLPRKTVYKWRKRFFEERLDGLVGQHRIGRPTLFPP